MRRMFRYWRHTYSRGYAFRGLWALLFCVSMGTSAQNTAAPVNVDAPFSIRATHVLGLEKTKNNCNGTLSIQGDVLRFQQSGKASTEIKIASIRDIFLNDEDKQVGGVPMTLGKAAAPFGGGRVISLVAHKNYDILTLEYIDTDGGTHGAIFQLSKGEGEAVRNQLVARGVSPSPGKDQQTKQSTAEVARENQ